MRTRPIWQCCCFAPNRYLLWTAPPDGYAPFTIELVNVPYSGKQVELGQTSPFAAINDQGKVSVTAGGFLGVPGPPIGVSFLLDGKWSKVDGDLDAGCVRDSVGILKCWNLWFNADWPWTVTSESAGEIQFDSVITDTTYDVFRVSPSHVCLLQIGKRLRCQKAPNEKLFDVEGDWVDVDLDWGEEGIALRGDGTLHNVGQADFSASMPPLST